MKRSVLLIAVAVALCSFGVSKAQAVDLTTANISVTVSLAESLSVSLDETAWNLGAVALSSTSDGATFTATVGNVRTDLNIKGANGAGGWTIGAAAGADTFVVAVTDPAITLTTSDQELQADVAAYGNKAFELKYSSPTSDTKGADVSQGFNITVTASKHS